MSSCEAQINLRIISSAGDPPVDMVQGALQQALGPLFKMEWRETWNCPPECGYTTLELRLAPLRQEGRSGEVPYSRPDRVSAHCDLLDRLNVPNGTKAIAIALHRHWSESLRAQFGEAASPSTIKHWRTERSRRRRAGRTPPPPRRDSGPRRVVRGLRRHHAVRTVASGSGIKEGYRRAIAELQIVNEGGHRFYRKPDAPLAPFSYETFRLDCIALRRGGGRRR